MEVNLTLVAQIVHFFIAYSLLKRYMFKPLVELVNEQDILLEEAKQAVEIRRALVSQQEKELSSQWAAAQVAFAKAMPDIAELTPTVLRSVPQEHVITPLSKDELDAIYATTKQKLIKRLEHVD